jgi:hypothetical protein
MCKWRRRDGVKKPNNHHSLISGLDFEALIGLPLEKGVDRIVEIKACDIRRSPAPRSGPLCRMLVCGFVLEADRSPGAT